MASENDGLVFTHRKIGAWTVPTIELPDATRNLSPASIFGRIANSTDENSARSQEWKVKVASKVRSKRGTDPWNPEDNYAITLAFCFHTNCSRCHGYNALDVENYIKPIIDALAYGLFSQRNPTDGEKWNCDDSNFNTLLIHRLDNATCCKDEGVAVAISTRPRNEIRPS